MDQFSNSKIDEHLKNVLIQKNNKIEMLEDELLEQESIFKEKDEQLRNYKADIFLREENYKDLSVRYEQCTFKKNKLKKYARKLKEKMDKIKERYGNDVQITEENESDNKPIFEVTSDKIMLDAKIQTNYLSPVNIILTNKIEILKNETSLENVKEAIDILCQIIGFSNLEEVMGEDNQIPEFRYYLFFKYIIFILVYFKYNCN